jgi:hypothetical protein
MNNNISKKCCDALSLQHIEKNTWMNPLAQARQDRHEAFPSQSYSNSRVLVNDEKAIALDLVESLASFQFGLRLQAELTKSTSESFHS